MNAWVFVLLPATLGVDYGWERRPDGTVEYVIQIEPEAVESMKTGTELISDLPPQLRNIRTYKIKVGRDRLPNHNQLPPELLGQTATGVATAAGNVAGYNPGAGSGAIQPGASPGFVNNSTNPAYNTATTAGTGYAPNAVAAATQPGYATQPTYGTTAVGPTYNPATSGYTNAPYSAAGQTPTQPLYFDAQGRPISYSAATTATLPTAASPQNYPTSTSGFPIAVAGATGYNPNYANPNYAQPNYTNPNYTAPPVYNAATGQMVNPATGLPVGQYQPATNPYGVPTTAYNEGPRFPDARFDGGGIPTMNAKPTIEVGGAAAAGQQPTQGSFVNTNNPGTYGNGPYAAGQYPQATGTAGTAQSVSGPYAPAGVEPRSASHDGTGASIGSTVAAAAEKQWLPLTMTLIGLFASLGANLYFGWTTYHLRERYRMLLSDRVPSY